MPDTKQHVWNPWHGCRKISPGCRNCYVFRIDHQHGRNPEAIGRTASFALPVLRRRDGRYRIPPGERLFTCLSSDFFLEEADAWRDEAWALIRMRSDLRFFLVTKRIDRFTVALPPDWGEGWPHVTVATTVEDQPRADSRLPVFSVLPIRHKVIFCEPLLGPLDLSPHLKGLRPHSVVVGGESGPGARPCHYDHVLAIRDQCLRAGVGFSFRQTGAVFVKDGRTYRLPRPLQGSQARKAAIDTAPAPDTGPL
ncbi:DUF5131 family protein [Phaeovibrio sulfidiphilus]|uniref:DUF5131 family protein n=1 Tax=Phaeovibrio sulfidiphilus TaxID=1220600 RepID=A0A8J7CDQ2_9PROT|nr:DUF5131 family protein [Phaeovibrio sulfidiphilus]MBE1237983.1 DUF5131 family protein [Phaeovibrio sulfidiphilus]